MFHEELQEIRTLNFQKFGSIGHCRFARVTWRCTMCLMYLTDWVSDWVSTFRVLSHALETTMTYCNTEFRFFFVPSPNNSDLACPLRLKHSTKTTAATIVWHGCIEEVLFCNVLRVKNSSNDLRSKQVALAELDAATNSICYTAYPYMNTEHKIRIMGTKMNCFPLLVCVCVCVCEYW